MKKLSLMLVVVVTLAMVFSLNLSAQSFEPLDCPCASLEFLEAVENMTCNAGYDEVGTKEKYYNFFYFRSFGWGGPDLWGEIVRGEDENPKARRCELGIGSASDPNTSLSPLEYVACKKYIENLSETLKSLDMCG
jgi:hypothetical protein